ncbi:unnamed protein product [Acanthosepion pharaonis]|uniref:Uncharacterized protein n=1 Tax=Acanthosepion pharaonis TaxID=158019 RepID=A0A812BXP5_ACAPH|nr:unnamed protein product [Sepia pharaonis]
MERDKIQMGIFSLFPNVCPSKYVPVCFSRYVLVYFSLDVYFSPDGDSPLLLTLSPNVYLSLSQCVLHSFSACAFHSLNMLFSLSRCIFVSAYVYVSPEVYLPLCSCVFIPHAQNMHLSLSRWLSVSPDAKYLSLSSDVKYVLVFLSIFDSFL